MPILQQARANWLTAPPRTLFTPITLTPAQRSALRGLFDPILARYGVDTSDSAPKLPISRAVRDAISRTLIHPHPPLHPDGHQGGLQSLPVGKVWADANAANAAYWAGVNKAVEDNNWFNNNINSDGYKMLQHFFGTNFDGAAGTLTRVAAGQWRIKTITHGDQYEYRFPQCSWQHVAAATVLRAYDIISTICSTVGHDGKCDFIPELSKWVWQCSTYNEEQVLDGGTVPLSPMTLHTLSAQGQKARIKGVYGLASGPDYDPLPFMARDKATDSTYFNNTNNHPNGMIVIGAMMGVGGNIGLPVNQQRARHVQVLTTGLQTDTTYGSNPTGYPRVMPEIAFPDLGVAVTEYTENPATGGAGSVTLTLMSTIGGTLRKRVNGGAWTNWNNWGDTLPVGTGTVEYGVLGGMSTIVKV